MSNKCLVKIIVIELTAVKTTSAVLGFVITTSLKRSKNPDLRQCDSRTVGYNVTAIRDIVLCFYVADNGKRTAY